jgi:PAS domain S-box-containing protein
VNQLKPIILCVDDEEANLRLLKKLLVPRGYVVVSAASGKEALLVMRNQTIDLVLLDIIMPGMNGFEVCRQIKEDPKLRSIPVIMISTLSAKQDRIRGIEAGAEEFLSKPFDQTEVLARIKILLKMKALDDERKLAESQREVALEELKKSNDLLERRVRERTVELAKTNEMLQADITERKRVEETLRLQSEIITNMSEGVNVIRASDKKIIYTNPRFDSLFGYEQGELIGKSVAILNEDTSEKTAQEIADSIEKAVIEKEQFLSEILFRRKEGSPFWCLIHVSAYQHPEYGQVYISVHSDITEKKRLGETLEKERKELKLIIDSSPIIVFYKDKEGRFIRINRTFAETLNMPEENFLGKTVFDLYSPQIAQGMTDDDQEVFQSLRPKLNIIEQYESASGIRWVQTDKIPVCDNHGVSIGLIGFAQDITVRKQAENMLHETKERYRNIFENTVMGISQALPDGPLITANNAYAQMYGYANAEEMMAEATNVGQRYANPEDREEVLRILKEKGVMEPRELVVVHRDGTRFTVLASAREIRDSDGNLQYYQAEHIDVTERKKVEEALKESEKKYRLLADNIHDVIFILDMNLNYTYVSPSVKILWGYEPIEVVKQHAFETLTPASINLSVRVLAEIMELEKSEHRDINISRTLQLETIRKNGTIVWVEVKFSFIRDENQQPVGILGLTRDITERKLAEEVLRESEDRYRSLYVDSKDSIMVISPDRGFITANPATIKLFACRDEQDFMNYSPALLSPEYQPDGVRSMDKSHEMMRLALKKGSHFFEWMHRRVNGTDFPATVLLSRLESGSTPLLQATVRDITDHKRAEEDLKESEKKYRLLADNIHDVIFILDMNLNYTYVSPSVKILWGYEPIEVVKQHAFETLTPSSMDLSVRVFAEIMELEKSEHRDINISRTLQLETIRKDGTIVWVEVKFSFIRDANQQSVGILGLTRDITERRKAEAELLLTLENLRKAFGTTVQVMVSAVEMKDPYTAGHQIRSADLACAIATEMGLAPEKIDGIRMAGSIHDIGKLSVPSEILSKPTKLTNAEFSVIKDHAQSGYEMLKNVESPWPLAQIVYQHHERMNGTGYPRNLKGDEILLDARIMAVADVVEAMASHRPYRPALGIEVALEEIEKNNGTFYDAVVADACLKLFREKGYKLLA